MNEFELNRFEFLLRFLSIIKFKKDLILYYYGVYSWRRSIITRL